MARQSILLVVLVAQCIFFLPVPMHLRAQDQLPPAGTAVEFLDGSGRVQSGEFVEKTTNGLIKVKLPNGTTLTFPPTRVRVAGGVVLNRGAPAAPKMKKLRTWTDATGMFKIEAEFVALADGKVELKKTDGKTVSLPLDKLAAADQDIAKFLAETNNPFEADVKDVTETIATQIAVWPRAREYVLDIEQFPLVRLDNLPAEMPWRGSVEAAQPPPPTLVNRSIPIPEYRADSFWAMSDMIIDEARQWAWVYQGNSRSSFITRGETPQYHVDRVNLRDGLLQPRIQFAQRDVPVAIDPTGQLLVTFNDDGRFHIWKIGADKLSAVSSFVIQKAAFTIFRETSDFNAAFLDADHLQLRTSSGLLTLRLTDFRPLYRFAAKQRVLSPSRKQMAIGESPHGLFLADTLSGRVLGRFKGFDAPEQRLGALAIPAKRFVESPHLNRVVFSPDGTQLLQLDAAEIRFFDLQSGQQIKMIGATLPSTGRFGTKESRLSWGSSGHLVLDGRVAIHAATGTATARISNDFPTTRSFGGSEWLLAKQDDSRDVLKLTLHTCTLPNEEMRRRAEQRKTNLAMPTGTKAAIVFDPNGGVISEADQERVRGAVAMKLKEIGVTIATAEELPDHFLKFTQIADGPVYLQIGSLRRDEFYWYTAVALPQSGASESPRINGFLQTVQQIPAEIHTLRFGAALVEATLTADGLSYREN